MYSCSMQIHVYIQVKVLMSNTLLFVHLTNLEMELYKVRFYSHPTVIFIYIKLI